MVDVVGKAGELARLAGPVAVGEERCRTRRSWTIDEKLAIVREAKTCGDAIALVARRHGMNANHLFNWMQRERDGTLDRRGLYAAPGGPIFSTIRNTRSWSTGKRPTQRMPQRSSSTATPELWARCPTCRRTG